MTSSPIKTAQDVELAQRVQAMAGQDPELIRFIAAAAIGSQRVVQALPYYSRVRFLAARNGVIPGTVTYTLPKGLSVRAFSYGQGEAMGQAGFSRDATQADTNLEKGKSTRGGETIEVHGISVVSVPVAYDATDPAETSIPSDARFLAFLLAQCALRVNLKGGSVAHDYGPLMLAPSPVGISGSGNSGTEMPPLAAPRTQATFASNGWPYAGNVYRLPEPYLWTPSGDTDSSLAISLELQQPLAMVAATRAAAAGIQAYTPPASLIQEFIVSLVTRSTESRGVNQ